LAGTVCAIGAGEIFGTSGEEDSAMLATIFVRIPLALVPLLPLPDSPRDCRLEVLTPQALEERTLDEFHGRVSAYVMVHRYLARSLAPVHMFVDEEATLVNEELRTALVAAYPQAGPGRIFTPAVGELLRTRIDHALRYGVVHRPMTGYERLWGEPAPMVNQAFPPVLESAYWPALAQVLPVIPEELEYLFWGRDLVLVDVDANLVIDVLRVALPESVRPGVVFE
jgi:hypothetical protein